MSRERYVISQKKKTAKSSKYVSSPMFAASMLLLILYLKNAKELKVKKTLSCAAAVKEFFILL